MKKRATTVIKRKAAGRAPAVKLNLAPIRKQLLAMREDLRKVVRNQEGLDTSDNGDSVDQASLSIEKELLFELSDNERLTLDQVEAALRKIEKGNYGLCESCQKPIAKPRLEALPFARYCINCQSSAETAPELVEQAPDFRSIGEESPRSELS